MEPEFSITVNNSELWNTEGINLTNISSMFVPMIKTKNRTTSNTIISMIYPVIVTEMVLSILCLVLSIIVYSILPEFKNVHGKNLMSLSSCLLTTYIFLCLDLALRLHISYAFCFTIAVVIHISFLATFFWTNVMAFDIWRNMTSMKRKNFERKRETNKYTKYSIYAWTTTVLTALPAVILESTDLVSVQYRPQFGVKRCWLSGSKAFTYYFHIPVGIILLGNLIMFSSTIRQLWLIKKMTAILQVKQQQKKLNLYLKLFIVMGITWFMEFLPLVIKSHKHRYRLYAAAGMLTALHGVLMFTIFIVKRRVIRQIQEKMSGAVSSQKLSISQLTSSTSGQQPTFQTYVNSETFEETEVYIFKKISGQN